MGRPRKKPEEPDVWAIRYATNQVLLDNGVLLPITNWIDAEGDPCDVEAAVAAVAGPLPWLYSRTGELWFCFSLADFATEGELSLAAN